MDSPDDPAFAYVGLSVDEARELARREGRPIRVVHPGDFITMEYIHNRINVTVVDHMVVRATLG